jgi:glycosyltransferase involved in cell wall biosynthesis
VKIPEPIFSVVIPTYNHFDSLMKSLEALSRQSLPFSQFEVVVVDDGSQDNTAERLRQSMKRWPFMLQVFSGQNYGPATARNSGVRAAKGSIIAFTDDDCLPEPGWLSAFAKIFEENHTIAGAEGQVVCPDPHPLRHWVENRTGGLCWTANMAFPRALLLQAGGFDETFPYPANEDIELRIRMLRLGPIVWTPAALVLHPARTQSLMATARKFRYLWGEYDLYRLHPTVYSQVKPLGHPTLTILFVIFLGPVVHIRDWWRFYLREPSLIASFVWLTVLERIQFLMAPFKAASRRTPTR